MFVNGGAGAERFLPSGPEDLRQVLAQPGGGADAEAAHAGHLAAEAQLGEDSEPAATESH